MFFEGLREILATLAEWGHPIAEKDEAKEWSRHVKWRAPARLYDPWAVEYNLTAMSDDLRPILIALLEEAEDVVARHEAGELLFDETLQ